MRYIISAHKKGKAIERWLQFDWKRGCKYPEGWWFAADEAHSMTENQMRILSEMLRNNDYEFQVIRVR